MKPLALRTQLTMFYTAILAVLLTALGFTYYQVLAWLPALLGCRAVAGL